MTDAELVALLLTEARSHRALDSAPPSDPPNEIWLRWFGDTDALDAAVQERLDAEDELRAAVLGRLEAEAES